MRNVDWKHNIQRSSVRCTSDYDEGTLGQLGCKFVECNFEVLKWEMKMKVVRKVIEKSVTKIMFASYLTLIKLRTNKFS